MALGAEPGSEPASAKRARQEESDKTESESEFQSESELALADPADLVGAAPLIMSDNQGAFDPHRNPLLEMYLAENPDPAKTHWDAMAQASAEEPDAEPAPSLLAAPKFVQLRLNDRVLYERALVAGMDKGVAIAHRGDAVPGIYSRSFVTCTATILRSQDHIGLSHHSLAQFDRIDEFVGAYQRQTGAQAVEVVIAYSPTGFRNYILGYERSHHTLAAHIHKLKTLLCNRVGGEPTLASEVVRALETLAADASDDERWNCVANVQAHHHFRPLIDWCNSKRYETLELVTGALFLPTSGDLCHVDARSIEVPVQE